jgi:transposase
MRMANRIKMAVADSILVLHRRGWSYRRIARELGIHRETVSRYVRQAAARDGETDERAGRKPSIVTAGTAADGSPKPAIPTAGNETSDPVKPAIPTPGNGTPDDPKPSIVTPGTPGQRSRCELFRSVIEEKLELGLSAQRIHQDLVAEHDFPASYSSVKRYVRRLRAVSPVPFRRLECEPGEEVQVDFGRGAPVVGPDGRRRIPKVFRMVLSYSRKGYSEAVWQEKTEPFLRCLENAYRDFGGVPRTTVIDNLRAAVSRADWYDPDVTPKVQSFCRHYGTVILPTRPGTPRHKGKVERGIGYVKDNALKGRLFESLAEQNAYLARWESRVADHRIHGTTRQQVKKRFETERPALLPLPAGTFPCFEEAQRRVHRDAHVEVAKAYYSVPPEYVGRDVWVRWDTRTVRIYNHRFEQIALHVRHEPGQFSTQPGHLDSRKICGVELGAEALLERTWKIGEHAGAWAEAMLQERGIQGVRVLLGLIHLTCKHRPSGIDEACRLALSHRAFRLKTLRRLLRDPSEQEEFDFIEEHPLIRHMSAYGCIVPVTFGSKGEKPQ